MHFSSDTKLWELEAAFPVMKGQFISGGDFFSGSNAEKTLAQLHSEQPAWGPEDILYGLENLHRVSDSNAQIVWPLPHASLVYLPAAKKQHTAFAVLAAGGAYGAVCTMVEAMPVAARLNALGFDCFCLNYRTAVPESFVSGLMPQPLDDLADALRLIAENRAVFDVDPMQYLLFGFSAGGHLCGSIGTFWNRDFAAFPGMKKGDNRPRGVILSYPAASLMPGLRHDLCTELILGKKDYTDEECAAYSLEKQVTEDTVPHFIWQTEEDDCVCVENSLVLAEALIAKRIPTELHIYPKGPHGMSVATKEVYCNTPQNIDPHVGSWVKAAVEWTQLV